MEQLAALALDAGIPRGNAAVMVAIPPCESNGCQPGGSSSAVGDTDTAEVSVGPWQIRTLTSRVVSAHQWGEIPRPDRKLLIERLKEPRYNAKWMRRISLNGTYIRPWSVTHDGKHEQFMDEAKRAVDKVAPDISKWLVAIPIIGPALAAGEAALDATGHGNINNPFDVADKVTEWLGANAARAAIMGAGAVLILIMLGLFVAPTVAKTAGAVL